MSSKQIGEPTKTPTFLTVFTVNNRAQN